MKFDSSVLKNSIIVSVLSLSIAGISAYAQTPPASPPHQHQHEQGPGMPQDKPEMDHHFMHDNDDGAFFGHGRQLAKLKDSLRLTPQQSALWNKAEQGMAPTPEDRARFMEKMKARHEQTLAALADPKFDPRKFTAEREKEQAEMQAQRKAKREAWFAVYDSLDAAQRGQVREFLRSQLEKMGGKHRMPEDMHGPRGMMHGPMDHGAPGKDMPMPAKP